MGQAKRRGTFEERFNKAIATDKAYIEKANSKLNKDRQLTQEELNKLTDKMKNTSSKHRSLITNFAIATISSHFQ